MAAAVVVDERQAHGVRSRSGCGSRAVAVAKAVGGGGAAAAAKRRVAGAISRDGAGMVAHGGGGQRWWLQRRWWRHVCAGAEGGCRILVGGRGGGSGGTILRALPQSHLAGRQREGGLRVHACGNAPKGEAVGAGGMSHKKRGTPRGRGPECKITCSTGAKEVFLSTHRRFAGMPS